jgi:hypothetical protein
MQDPPPAPAAPPQTLRLPERVQPRPRPVELLEGAAGEVAARIDELVRGRGEGVVAAGRGAGDDLEPYRRLAERYGGRFAVSRPQVEAARATRADLVGASSQVVAPDVYLAFGISGAIPHLVGMAESGTVVAINTDRSARIFDHADFGALADAEQVARRIATGPIRVTHYTRWCAEIWGGAPKGARQPLRGRIWGLLWFCCSASRDCCRVSGWSPGASALLRPLTAGGENGRWRRGDSGRREHGRACVSALREPRARHADHAGGRGLVGGECSYYACMPTKGSAAAGAVAGAWRAKGRR